MNEIQQTEGYIENALKEYTVTDAMIAELTEKCMVLKCEGLEDKDGYAIVHSARMDVKKARIDVEKTRKALKEQSLVFSRAVDGEAKRITALLKPIEEHLLSQENAVDEEKKRIKEQAAKELKEKIDARIKDIYDLGMVFDGSLYVYEDQSGERLGVSDEHIRTMDDDEFQAIKEKAFQMKKADEQMKAEQEEKRKAEESRLQKEKEEQERVRIEQEKKEADLKAQQRKIDADKAEADEKRWKFRLSQLKEVGWNGQEAFDSETEEVIVSCEALIISSEGEFSKLLSAHNKSVDDRAKERKELEAREAKEAEAKRIQDEKDAKEKAEREAKEKAEQEAIEKAEAEEQERIKKELAEKLKPDNEKLIALASSITELPMPELSIKQSHEILDKAKGHLDRAVQILRQGS